MIRTHRLTLNQTPQDATVSPDAGFQGHTVTLVAQAAGTLVIVDDAVANPDAAGARVAVQAGTIVKLDDLASGEALWVATDTATGTLAVDIIQQGV